MAVRRHSLTIGWRPRWDGQTRYVEADAADTTPLVGMRLLDGYRVNNTSKVVLPTVKLGPPDWTKSRTFLLVLRLPL